MDESTTPIDLSMLLIELYAVGFLNFGALVIHFVASPRLLQSDEFTRQAGMSGPKAIAFTTFFSFFCTFKFGHDLKVMSGKVHDQLSHYMRTQFRPLKQNAFLVLIGCGLLLNIASFIPGTPQHTLKAIGLLLAATATGTAHVTWRRWLAPQSKLGAPI